MLDRLVHLDESTQRRVHPTRRVDAVLSRKCDHPERAILDHCEDVSGLVFGCEVEDGEMREGEGEGSGSVVLPVRMASKDDSEIPQRIGEVGEDSVEGDGVESFRGIDRESSEGTLPVYPGELVNERRVTSVDEIQCGEGPPRSNRDEEDLAPRGVRRIAQLESQLDKVGTARDQR